MRISKQAHLIYLTALIVLTLSINSIVTAQDSDINIDKLHHDSYDSLYRTPSGAVPIESTVTLRFRTETGNAKSVDLRLYRTTDENESLVPMQIVATTPDGYDIWETQVTTGRRPTVYYYRFVVRSDNTVVYYEDDTKIGDTFIPALEGGVGTVYTNSPDLSYQISVYDPAFYTPEWMRNGIIYQIFPDRFRNGDPTNDPTDGSELFYGELPLYFHEIWNEPPVDGRTTQPSNSSIGYYNSDFYGGDLAGIIEKLNYLQELGVTILYLNPIFEARSNHRYDTVDYLAIDPILGTIDDFRTLLSEAESRGIHVILDGVFNHMSSDSPAFDRYHRFDVDGACENVDSLWRSWFIFKAPRGAQPDACVENPDGQTYYESWAGFDSIPKLNSSQIEVRQHVFLDTDSVAQTWGREGIGGWRLDVAGDIDNGRNPTELYWEAFRSIVRHVNPEAVIIGEEWNDATEWLLGDEWDSVMNYRLRRGIIGFVRNTPFLDNDGVNQGANPLSPREFDGVIRAIESDYPDQAYHALMNLLGSHDTTRAFFAFENNPDLLKLATLTQFALPGAPMIYYGDEIAIDAPSIADAGGVLQDDPYNRAPYPWPDTEGTHYPAPNDEMLTYYQELATIRHNNPALREGEMITLLAEEERGLYIFARIDRANGNIALVALNNSEEERGVDINFHGLLPTDITLTPLFTNQTITTDSNPVRMSVQAMTGEIWTTTIDPTAFAVLKAPDNIQAEGSDGSVNIFWSATSNATTYQIYRSPVPNGGFEPIGEGTPDTTYTDQSVANGFRYYYTVAAIGANGLPSEQGAVANAVPSASIASVFYIGDEPSAPQPDRYEPEIIPLTIGAQSIFEAAIEVDGVTSEEGQGAGIQAQAAVIPADSSLDQAEWHPMSYATETGDADVYRITLAPQRGGEYQLAARFSTDAGSTWTVVRLRDESLPRIIVEASNDTTPPNAPSVVNIDRISLSGVMLSWDAVDDTELYGYRIYRQADGEDTFSQISEIPYGEPLSFLDTAVAQNTRYTYAVSAIDSALNESTQTDTETVMVERQVVAVTFVVSVPASTGTDVVFIAGNFGTGDYPTWDPAGIPMTQVDETHWTVTLNLPEASSIEYKFVRGTWDAVEKGDECEEIANRTLSVIIETSGGLIADGHSVQKWRDIDACG